MKSSRRSSGSSRATLNDLLSVGLDSYDQERVRLALEDTEWLFLPPVSRVGLVPRPVHHPLSSVLLVSSRSLCVESDPLGGPSPVPVLACGEPATLELLAPDHFDDFLASPWTREELLYRLRRLAGSSSLRCSGGRLEWGRHWLAATHGTDRIRVTLTPSQHAALDLLARSPGEIVARETMLAAAREAAGTGRALDMQVSRLRGRLAEVTVGWRPPPRIRSLRGDGYCLEIS